jgi:hypothetical protein
MDAYLFVVVAMKINWVCKAGWLVRTQSVTFHQPNDPGGHSDQLTDEASPSFDLEQFIKSVHPRLGSY